MGAFKAKCEHFDSCPLFTEASCAWIADDTHQKFFCKKTGMHGTSVPFAFKRSCGVCGSELHNAADCFKAHEESYQINSQRELAGEMNTLKTLVHVSGEMYSGAMEQVKKLKRQLEEIDPSGFTYVSRQATDCAVCGLHKHTPIRNDAMGGYVCLTCIDKELIRLQAASPEKINTEG